MKKNILFFMVVCIVIIFGCVGMKEKKSVLQDNIFISSTFPKIKIQINQDFKYIGKVEKQKHENHTTGYGGTFINYEYYIFLHPDNNNSFTKGALIRRSELASGYWLPDVFSKVKDKIDSGGMKINGKYYKYAVFSSASVFNNYEELFIYDKGYEVPNCFLVKGLGRRIGAGDKNLIKIIYFEDMRTICDNKYSCKGWNNKETLTAEQVEYLKKFNENYLQNIQILKYDN